MNKKKKSFNPDLAIIFSESYKEILRAKQNYPKRREISIQLFLRGIFPAQKKNESFLSRRDLLKKNSYVSKENKKLSLLRNF